jgi:hypothetical protein
MTAHVSVHSISALLLLSVSLLGLLADALAQSVVAPQMGGRMIFQVQLGRVPGDAQTVRTPRSRAVAGQGLRFESSLSVPSGRHLLLSDSFAARQLRAQDENQQACDGRRRLHPRYVADDADLHD